MSKLSTSEEAIRKRRSRVKQAQTHRRATFISEYIRVKHRQIYEEADNFYAQLVGQYPNKRKLSTCLEYKLWEAEIRKGQDPSTRTASISSSNNSSSTTTSVNSSVEDNMQLTVELMDSSKVQETRDSLVFGDIHPSLVEEINPEILDEIIREVQESDVNIFNYNQPDEDINDILDAEINNSINELDLLEEELLKY